MNGQFGIASGYSRYNKYLLNPALGDAEVSARTRSLEAVQLRVARFEWWSFGLGLGATGLFVFGIVALSSLGPLPLLATALPLAACIALWKSAVRTAAGSLSARERWVKSGEALPIGFLDEFKFARLDAQAAWRAAGLLQRADATNRRVRWALRAQEDGRLASGSVPALDDADEVVKQMYQEAADILDPSGVETSRWLLEKVAE